MPEHNVNLNIDKRLQREIIADAAKQFSKELVGQIVVLFIIGWLIITGFNVLMEYLGVGFDSTDGTERSHMTIRVDCETGFEYLADQRGGLTPRLGEDGDVMRAPITFCNP